MDASVQLFVEEGAKVVIAGRRNKEGEALARQLGVAATFVRTDVSREADAKAMIDYALAKFGRVDCLINNAGGPGKVSTIADLDLEDFDMSIAVHLRGTVLGMKHVAPIMLHQGSGSIINTGSTSVTAQASQH